MQNLAQRKTTLTTLVKKYNVMQVEALVLHRSPNTPAGARPPNPIDIAQFYRTEHDPEQLADAAFDYAQGMPVPDWLAKTTTRHGINGELATRRAEEENARLDVEYLAVQRWLGNREHHIYQALQHNAGKKFRTPAR